MLTIQPLQDRDHSGDARRLSARLEAYRDREQQVGPRPIENEEKQPRWSGVQPVPEVAADSFSNDLLLSAMASHGCLIVRGFFDTSIADVYTPIIDQLLDTVYSDKETADAAISRQALYNPPEALSTLLSKQVWANSRGFHRRSGSVM